MRMDSSTLFIVALVAVGFYLVSRATGSAAAQAVTNAPVDANRLPSWYVNEVLPVSQRFASACPDGQYMGTSLIGQPTCLPIGAVS